MLKKFKLILDIEIDVKEIEGEEDYFQSQNNLLKALMSNENALSDYLKYVTSVVVDESLKLYSDDIRINGDDEFKILIPVIESLEQEDRDLFLEAIKLGYFGENVDEFTETLSPKITNMTVEEV